ncbi:GNAT family N-acetyltransferase [Rhodobium gokarnense]|uniref:Phosphinothricin acetyltransferase n=1 Tax=Rhodobium gokarnense TaxID=364296 RepID=A0ABT3H8P6_9HYPH|nr:GNAT family N-acetyltransferase [Rhodobium gokarnense]MCW2306739.1 phosphinothricin acetyltransferase [Rhodobium gokarnense]
MQIRPATTCDLDAITRIYGEAVATGTASFELTPPDVVEMALRWSRMIDAGYPYLVADIDGAIAGYAYAGAYRARPAYYGTVENAIYVDAAFRRRGVARALMEAVIAAAAERDFRQMIAVIGDSDNAASIGLHEACGFRHIGTFKSVGYKHGRWLDTVMMQRELGEGDRTPPGE